MSRRLSFVSFIAAVGLAGLACLQAVPASAQAWSQRGFVEARGVFFPAEAPGDTTRTISDLLVREEIFATPAAWLKLSGGLELRAATHQQVDEDWQFDAADRSVRRPRVALRRLVATFHRGPVTIDIGKQFMRWGKTDILTPTDRFAPRDFMNVVDAEFLPVTGVRASFQRADDALELVWVPALTPSRLPLLNQRWAGGAASTWLLPLVDAGSDIPSGSQFGARWAHTGAALEWALSAYDGYNHLPVLDATPIPGLGGLPAGLSVTRRYGALRSAGLDAAVPTRWVTLKAEAAFLASSTPGVDDYLLYVVQAERQSGEWQLVGGYAGQLVTAERSTQVFAPDRGLTRAFVARASYTLDPNRSLAFEGALRQTGSGAWGKAEYSQAHGAHWRLTATGVFIGGEDNDFLGQYRRNSHVSVVVRYSF